MSAERRAAIARKGGVVVQASGLGHQWTPDEARAAGRKGGLATAQAKRERA
jgi:general stress protein YciG